MTYTYNLLSQIVDPSSFGALVSVLARHLFRNPLRIKYRPISHSTPDIISLINVRSFLRPSQQGSRRGGACEGIRLSVCLCRTVLPDRPSELFCTKHICGSRRINYRPLPSGSSGNKPQLARIHNHAANSHLPSQLHTRSNGSQSRNERGICVHVDRIWPKASRQRSPLYLRYWYLLHGFGVRFRDELTNEIREQLVSSFSGNSSTMLRLLSSTE